MHLLQANLRCGLGIFAFVRTLNLAGFISCYWKVRMAWLVYVDSINISMHLCSLVIVLLSNVCFRFAQVAR